MVTLKRSPCPERRARDRGLSQRETGMDQGTTPDANFICLFGKKKPWQLRAVQGFSGSNESYLKRTADLTSPEGEPTA